VTDHIDMEAELASLVLRDLSDLIAMAMGRRVSLRLRRRWARTAGT
jgi:hypothetical protein